MKFFSLVFITFVYSISVGQNFNNDSFDFLLPINYGEVYDFDSKILNKNCLLNLKTNEIHSSGYDKIISLKNRKILANKYNKWLYLEPKGREIARLNNYHELYNISNTQFLGYINSTWFKIDIITKKETKIDMDSLIITNENYSIIKKNNFYAVIDSNLNFIINFQSLNLCEMVENNFISYNNGYDLVDFSLNKITNNNYESLFRIDSNLLIGIKNNSEYLIDLKGTIIANYDNFLILNSNKYIAQNDFNCNLINETELIISCVKFHLNKPVYFIVRKGNKKGLIDIYNNIILPIEYDELNFFNSNNLLELKKGDKLGIFNLESKKIIEPKYRYFANFEPCYLQVGIAKNKWQLLNLNGEMIYEDNEKLEVLDSLHIISYTRRGQLFINLNTKQKIKVNGNFIQYKNNHFIEEDYQTKRLNLVNNIGESLISHSNQLIFINSNVYGIKNDSFFEFDYDVKKMTNIVYGKKIKFLNKDFIGIETDSVWKIMNLNTKSFIKLHGSDVFMIQKYFILKSDQTYNIYDLNYNKFSSFIEQDIDNEVNKVQFGGIIPKNYKQEYKSKNYNDLVKQISNKLILEKNILEKMN